mmetsp:Transcript_17959/g.62016  ORF Transcript_17959/g.62016 Transcript_17959/m.62016 type:complete len:144 (+) Transcript_17959:535-966(+)
MMLFGALGHTGTINVVSFGREKQIPEKVVHRLIQAYTDTGKSAPQPGKQVKFTRTGQLQEKLIAHVVLLALHVGEYVVDINELAQALGCEKKNVAMHAKHAGCGFAKMKFEGSTAKAYVATLGRLAAGSLATVRAPEKKKYGK